jgi:hypothetical protein
MTGPDTNTQDGRPAATIRRVLGVPGVLLGVLIATCMGRLMRIVLADGLDGRKRRTVPTQYRQVTAAPVEAE